MTRIAVDSGGPAAIGPYSQAVRAGDTLYLSGQTPLDPSSGELVAGDISAQATQVFGNLEAVLAAAGATFDDVVRVGIYLTLGVSFTLMVPIFLCVVPWAWFLRRAEPLLPLPRAPKAVRPRAASPTTTLE